MGSKVEKTFWVKVYISGPIDQIKQICRKYAKRVGLCVTVEPTTFIYTGGEELGAVIGVINYPRFPANSNEIYIVARSLANELLRETYQRSILIMTPDETEWITDDE